MRSGIYSMSFWNAKIVEPNKRMVGGNYGWAIHRFPIKDGISLRDAMLKDMCKPNPLLKLLDIEPNPAN